MPPRFRTDLQPLLEEFAHAHRGVRLGKMFGRPAIYAGRRLFACLMDDGLIVRLPGAVARTECRERGKVFGSSGKPAGSWVMYRPETLAEARQLTVVIEVAARHVARLRSGDGQ